MTFFAVLSLFPGLLILAGALGSLDAIVGHDLAARSRETALDFMGDVLTERASFLIDSVRALFEGQVGGLVTAGALISTWTLSSGFAALIRALGIVYGLVERRPWLDLRLTALALAVGSVLAMVILLASIVVGPLLGGGRALSGLTGMGGGFSFAWDWLRLPAAFVLQVAWATTLYHLAPNRRERTPWFADLPGGLLAAALALAVSYGFHGYLRLAAGLNQILGVLGGGLILMMWLYMLSLVVLLGGLLNGVLQGRAGGSSP